MTINFNQKIINIVTGEILLDEVEKELTLKTVCVNSLLAFLQSENIEGQEKLLRFTIAKKIIDNENANLTSEEIFKTKEMVGKVYNSMIVGQVFQMLEGENK